MAIDAGEKIRRLRVLKGWGQEALDRLLGVAEGRTYSYEKSRAQPASDYLAKLAELSGVSRDWFTDGEDSLPAIGQSTPATKPEPEDEKRLVGRYPGKLKLEGTVGAGEADIWEMDEDIVYVPNEYSREDFRGLIVHTAADSLMPYIRPGDLAVLRQTKTKHYGKVGALREKGASTSILKMVEYDDDGNTRLTSTNPKYKPIIDGDYEYRGVLVALMSGDGMLKIGPYEGGLGIDDIKRELQKRL